MLSAPSRKCQTDLVSKQCGSKRKTVCKRVSCALFSNFNQESSPSLAPSPVSVENPQSRPHMCADKAHKHSTVATTGMSLLPHICFTSTTPDAQKCSTNARRCMTKPACKQVCEPPILYGLGMQTCRYVSLFISHFLPLPLPEVQKCDVGRCVIKCPHMQTGPV